MNTCKLARIGIILVGGGLLSVNIVSAVVAAYPASQATVIVPGIAAGAVLVAGAIMKKTAGRRFIGACMALAGAVFLLSGIANSTEAYLGSDITSVLNAYRVLLFGPIGSAMGVALLVIGIKLWDRERLAGLCMAVPGVGFLPYLVFISAFYASETGFVNSVLLDEISIHSGAVVGAAMLVPSLVMVWQNGRMQSEWVNPMPSKNKILYTALMRQL